MTKAELVKQICQQTGVSREDALAVVESCMNNIKTKLSEGEDVYLRGFGTFTLKKRAEKKETVIEKLKGFFERFFGIGPGDFSEKNQTATEIAERTQWKNK